MIFKFLTASLVSFLFTYFSLLFFLPRMKEAGIVGRDVHKEERIEVVKVGGIFVVFGFSIAMLSVTFLNSFFTENLDNKVILSVLLSSLILSLIGIIDDLGNIPQKVKALLPIFSAFPLIALQTYTTFVDIPFFGRVDFSYFYIFFLLPLAMTVASNLTNMFAGYNGLEAGVGLVMYLFLFITALLHGKMEMAVISLAMFFSLLAFFLFNKYPAKTFPGDVLTLVIGGTLMATCISSNFEKVAVILLIPHGIEGIIKFFSGLPTGEEKAWMSIVKKGKLYAPKKKSSLVHYILSLLDGLEEWKIPIVFGIIEIFFGLIALVL